MEQGSKIYCNVCLVDSDVSAKIVYLKAVCEGEEVHICTSCIPAIIHGSGEIVKSNSEVEKALKG